MRVQYHDQEVFRLVGGVCCPHQAEVIEKTKEAAAITIMQNWVEELEEEAREAEEDPRDPLEILVEFEDRLQAKMAANEAEQRRLAVLAEYEGEQGLRAKARLKVR